jgi:hypothetical protein
MVAARKYYRYTHCQWCGDALPIGRTVRRKYCEGDICRSNFNNAKRSNRFDSQNTEVLPVNVVSFHQDGANHPTRNESQLDKVISLLERTIENQSNEIATLRAEIAELKSRPVTTAASVGNSQPSPQHESQTFDIPDLDDDLPMPVVVQAKEKVDSSLNFVNMISNMQAGKGGW